ncbi:hypothetical protein TRFO_13377 [Tritrichomonas foetus]|uniref:Uncharacterized protein n=1 Tax=Tritrichomonas foetus TaxID=1144522 RepID=A0A1J4L2U2_9EUKA|nr:hypothetical protein TRFO_13377 [Tritrichomonas foetus]|eukprot:OHT16213.1 hypothetical protein TRFO_13377 [Tritrichomonas foetus]
MAILNSSTPINIQDLKIIDSSLEIIGVIRIENVVVVGGAYISPSQSLQINKFTLDYFNIYGSEPYEINLREEILINNLVFLPRLISHKYTLIGTYYRISNITIDSTFIGKDGYSRYDSYLLPEIEGKKSLININNITFKHDLKIHDDILNFLCKGCLFGMKNRNDLLTNIFLNLEPSYIKDRKIKMACRGGGSYLYLQNNETVQEVIIISKSMFTNMIIVGSVIAGLMIISFFVIAIVRLSCCKK